MYISIGTILRDHGISMIEDVMYSHGWERKTLENISGTDVSIPLSYYSKTRDALLVFKDGLYLTPGIGYSVLDGPFVRFTTSLSGNTVSFVILKSAKIIRQNPVGSEFEDSSIRLCKLDAGILSKLISPAGKDELMAKKDRVRNALDNLSKDFAAIELRFAIQDRILSGSLIGDDFKTSPIGVTYLEGYAGLPALTVGQTIITAETSSVSPTGLQLPFAVGDEITIYDNVASTRRTITAITGMRLTLNTPLTNDFKAGAIANRSTGVRSATGFVFSDWYDRATTQFYGLASYDLRYRIRNVKRIVMWFETRNATVDVAAFRKQTGQADTAIPVTVQKKIVGNETQIVVTPSTVGEFILRITFTRTNASIKPTYVRLLGGYEPI